MTERATRENLYDVDIDYFCATMVHPNTGETITQYKKLAQDANPEILDIWQTGSGKEIGCMSQGNTKTKTKGKNCIVVMAHTQLSKMYSAGDMPTYARLIVNFRP